MSENGCHIRASSLLVLKVSPGAMLRHLRGKQALSQQALAEKLGSTQHYISELEVNQERSWTVAKLQRIFGALGYEVVVGLRKVKG